MPDLDEVEEFFADVLGCEVLYRASPLVDESVLDWMERNLGVHPDSTMRLVKMSTTTRHSAEIIQRTAIPEHHSSASSWTIRRSPSTTSRGVHMIDIQGESRLAGEGPEAGQTFVYFTAPWGLRLELIHTPPDVAYEVETYANPYGPAPDWNARTPWDDN